MRVKNYLTRHLATFFCTDLAGGICSPGSAVSFAFAMQVLQRGSWFPMGIARPSSRVRDSTDPFPRVTTVFQTRVWGLATGLACSAAAIRMARRLHQCEAFPVPGGLAAGNLHCCSRSTSGRSVSLLGRRPTISLKTPSVRDTSLEGIGFSALVV